MDTADAVVGAGLESRTDGITRGYNLTSVISSFLACFKVFDKFQPFMIGEIASVDAMARTAIVIDHKTQRQIVIRFDKSIERILTKNKSKFVEIIGKIRIDRHYNPISISSINKIIPVDTSDIRITEVLPKYLVMISSSEPAIKVELNEDNRFYSAELRDLNIFACGFTRDELKENLKESVDICWDEFVREDDSDFALSAQTLRKMLLKTFKEV